MGYKGKIVLSIYIDLSAFKDSNTFLLKCYLYRLWIQHKKNLKINEKIILCIQFGMTGKSIVHIKYTGISLNCNKIKGQAWHNMKRPQQF
jgi:hypothetical protein